ncbi:heterokaryon incompatibility protein-domain-containing protein [Cladorrhinum sp. PSN332]|nr:heterokaryon incompatibility protein-domain-containing protein [Cladorrhinum sp. PSN332]
MRLLNTETYELETVLHPNEYAILSHTWGGGEVTFDDLKDLNAASQKQGWGKIKNTCRLALEQGIRYAWIDTCCIDKSSSAELSEAINSMFRWYKESTACCVYLSDLSPVYPSRSDLPTDNPRLDPFVANHTMANLHKCRWFTRGWTLQELIAPRNMSFFDKRWICRGSKQDLLHLLTTITGIDNIILLNPALIPSIPVAKKMSWAANRQTTRAEDMAYSLLGIFDEEIAKSTNDLSLFAWVDPVALNNDYHDRWYGILATSPSQFSRCSELANIHSPVSYFAQSFSITNRGVEFRTCLKVERASGDCLMPLHCVTSPSEANSPDGIVICLLKTPRGFVRHRAGKFITDSVTHGDLDELIDPAPGLVWVLKTLSGDEFNRVVTRFHQSFAFRATWTWTPERDRHWTHTLTTYDPRERYMKEDPSHPVSWDESTSRFMTDGQSWFTGLLYLMMTPKEEGIRPPPVWIFCGFTQVKDEHGNSTPTPWIVPWAEERGGGWEEQKGIEVQDKLPDMRKRSRSMHYPFFLAYAGRKIREMLDAQGFIQPEYRLKNREFNLRVYVGVATGRDDVEAIHRVQITIQNDNVRRGPRRASEVVGA